MLGSVAQPGSTGSPSERQQDDAPDAQITTQVSCVCLNHPMGSTIVLLLLLLLLTITIQLL